MFKENLMESLGTYRRRDRLSIMAEVLETARNGCLKSQIMYRASLSFAQLNEYLKHLLEARLLKNTRENEKAIYRTTRKGANFLQNYYNIMDLLRRKKRWSLIHPSLTT